MKNHNADEEMRWCKVPKSYEIALSSQISNSFDFWMQKNTIVVLNRKEIETLPK
jgi:hypothetical protein